MGTSKLSGKPDEMLVGNLRCNSIPSRGGGIAIILVDHPTETGGWGNWFCVQNLPFLTFTLLLLNLQVPGLHLTLGRNGT